MPAPPVPGDQRVVEVAPLRSHPAHVQSHGGPSEIADGLGALPDRQQTAGDDVERGQIGAASGPTGGQVVAEEVGLKLDSADMSLLGSARKVVVTKDETTIVEGAGDAEQIQGRVNQIRAEIEKSDSDYDREKLQERVAKLAGGVAVIKVGAATEIEMKEKKARVEDALHSTRAAGEEGSVAGGGGTLSRAIAARTRLVTAFLALSAGRPASCPRRDSP